MTGGDKVVRLWDANWHLVYSSADSEQTVEEFMAGHQSLNYTVDSGHQRWSGRLVRNGTALTCYLCEEFVFEQARLSHELPGGFDPEPWLESVDLRHWLAQ